MSSGFPDDPFWEFSLAVYGASGVPAACLDLQERYRIDVNLLLWSIWCGSVGYPAFTVEDLARAESRIGDWHVNVVRHIRWLRQHLKAPYPHVDEDLQQSLRARLQKTEIESEHLEQITLAALAREAEPTIVDDASTCAKNGAANAALYLRAAGAEASGEDADTCATVVAAAFPELPAAEIRKFALDAMGRGPSG